MAVALLSAPALCQPVPVFSPGSMDRSANPCEDFYQYACGGWLKANPLPPDQTRWARFNLLADQNLAVLRQLMETGANAQVRTAWQACMNEEAIARSGMEPLKADLESIAALANARALTGEIARLHRNGSQMLFTLTAQPDFKDAKRQIAVLFQGALGLPDREIYLKMDARSDAQRLAYVAHVEAMLQLAGFGAEAARRMAGAVLAMETKLASSMVDNVRRRDPKNVYHIYTLDELVSLAPGFDWKKYFELLGARESPALNVSYPPYFRQLESLIVQAPLDSWKALLTWHTIREAARLMPAAFVEENFRFYGQTLEGQKQPQPRWKRCVIEVSRQLRDPVSKGFVEATFGEDGKRRMDTLVEELRRALGRDIDSLDWMTAATKKEAHAKLDAVSKRIGYPGKWVDYSGIDIRADDALGNSRRAGAFRTGRTMAKIGRPVDRDDWEFPAQTVDAFYDGTRNEITFPAGILQPPFFDKNADDAVNYGAIGSVIGHEFTHGFDDQGRKFDAAGNLRDWWTAEDAAEYEKRSQCIVEQYSGYESAGLRLNGRLTLGENTADNGGARIAFLALAAALARKTKPTEKIDGFTAEQRFFLAFGQTWCGNASEEFARMLVSIDPHSPGRARANGTVSNMPEFQKAFGCTAGQPMVRRPACRVW